MGDDQIEKRMGLRYAGTCSVCAVEIAAKTEAIYNGVSKSVRCLEHDGQLAAAPDLTEAIDVGTPGSSARREFERRKAKREGSVRAKHPKLGNLILAVTEDQQSTKAWDIGASGEERLGARLNELSGETLRLLHDRRIPGTRANVDHLAVTPSGVYVIDAKKYKGRPYLTVEGGILRPRVEKLIVGTRDCTKLVDGVLKQVELVRSIVESDFPVHGVLCFVDADWPLVGGSFSIRTVQALWPKKIYQMLQAPGALEESIIAETHHKLAAALPRA